MTTVQKNFLDDIKNRLIHIYHPEFIYLFGSYAWGNPDEDSDFDFFVVVESSSFSMSDRIRAGFSELTDISKPLDLMVLTRDEFDAKKQHPSSLSHKVITQGIKLYESA